MILFWSSASYYVRAMRWRILLNSQKHIPRPAVFWANMAGYLGNTILPARAGELVRAAYVARRENIPVVFVLATGLTERLVDLAALVFIGAVSIFFAESFPGPMQEALQGFAAVAVLGVIFIFMLPLFRERIIRVISLLPFLGAGFKSRLQDMLGHFVDGVRVVARFEIGLPFLLLTAVIWLMDGFGTILFALSVHEKLSLAQSFLFIAALGISSAIPSTPGYVGVYQFVAVTVLSPFGFSREAALALILLLQFLNLFIVAVWGGLGLWVGSRGILSGSTNNIGGDIHE